MQIIIGVMIWHKKGLVWPAGRAWMTALVDLLAEHKVVYLLELQGDWGWFLTFCCQLLAATTVTEVAAVVVVAVVFLRLGHYRHL